MHRKLGECAKTELDLFSVLPTQVSLETGLWIDHQPVSSVSDGGPITFLCPGTEDYVDLSKTILVVCAKVTKANGNNLTTDEHVGIVSNFLHSLFRQVDVFLKEKPERMLTVLTWKRSSTMAMRQKSLNDSRYVLQRYSRQDGRCRSYTGSC